MWGFPPKPEIKGRQALLTVSQAPLVYRTVLFLYTCDEQSKMKLRTTIPFTAAAKRLYVFSKVH